ncbi:MAG: hypothetical protein M1818_006517 [Claussenomyces sp. TS43310]|nr:MAG: hypothetical protein M1818_006517 [Claussenomyces sp. TS43310]
MADQAELQVMGEKTLHHAADPCLLAYCPSMELLAVGCIDQQVLVNRLNGQRVYAITQKGGSATVTKVGWKPNGQLLATAWSDGVVRLVGAESNKIVHHIPVTERDSMEITCLNWASNLTHSRSSTTKHARHVPSWKDFIEESEDDITSDLPRDLALIDVESSMPKLSILPAGGTSEDIFSSRASLDGLFRGFDPRDNEVVDVMIVGTADGRVHLSIYDSFVIGSFPPPLCASGPGKSGDRLVLHASHKAYSTHSLIISSLHTEGGLYLVPMNLRFVSISNNFLSLIASKSTALQNLLRYINQVLILMTAEWKSTQDLPSRFLGNINESLAEKNCPNIVQSMYHQVATGHTIPAVKEWLVDELAERGHKRWDKAVTSGLENLRKLVHENMLPALERCSVILSRLAGIAKYQGSNNTVGFSSQQISLVIDTVSCLTLVSARILTYTVDEIDLFGAFSTWLRHEIDRLTSSGTSAASDDLAENEAMIDHGKVLLYIQTAMNNSKLAAFFQDATSEDYQSQWDGVEQELPMFELLDSQLRKHDDGQSYLEGLPKVNSVCKYLERQANVVFQQIAESERRNVIFGRPVQLGTDGADVLKDMIVCPEDEKAFSTYVMMAKHGANSLRIHRVSTRIENGISTNTSNTATAVGLGDGVIKDVAFLDETSFLVLWHSKPGNIPGILRLSYQATSSTLSYVSPSEILARNPPLAKAPVSYAFPTDTAFVPDKLEVRRSRSGVKGLDTARICVLSKNRLRYRVMKIPNGSNRSLSNEDVQMS